MSGAARPRRWKRTRFASAVDGGGGGGGGAGGGGGGGGGGCTIRSKTLSRKHTDETKTQGTLCSSKALPIFIQFSSVFASVSKRIIFFF